MSTPDNITPSAVPDMIMIPRAKYEMMVAENARNSEAVKEFEVKLLRLQQQIEQYTRMLFGSRSERFIPIFRPDPNRYHFLK